MEIQINDTYWLRQDYRETCTALYGLCAQMEACNHEYLRKTDGDTDQT